MFVFVWGFLRGVGGFVCVFCLVGWLIVFVGVFFVGVFVFFCFVFCFLFCFGFFGLFVWFGFFVLV